MEKDFYMLEELKKQDPEKYFQEVLDMKEFEGLKTLVENSKGAISWEELEEDGVVKIDGNKVEGIYWKGNLDLRKTEVKSLWKLKKIGGELNCYGLTKLEDIGNLEEVEEGFDITGTKIDNLKKLNKVGGEFTIIGTKLKSLGKLKEVGGKLACTGVKTLEDLGNLLSVGWSVDLKGTSIKSLGKLKNVGGSLNCDFVETLEDLGELEEVGKNLYLEGTKIVTLKNLKKIGGYLFCDGLETLENLGKLEEVGGTVNILETKIKSLGKLEKVWGDLDCEYIETLEDLGELVFIGGNCKLDGTSIIFQKQVIKKIGNGKLVIEGKLIVDENISKIYESGNIDYEKFREVYGENIGLIEDKEIRKQVANVLFIEYEERKECLKEKGNRIKEENEGKKLTEEEKIGLREKITEIGKELKKIREKIESFGVRLDDL